MNFIIKLFMLEILDYKLVIAIIATILTVFGYVPYLRDIFAKKTKPHLYTWLIWGITQGIATAVLLYGGGKFGSLSLIIQAFLIFAVFLFSFKYGTKDITKSDKFILAVALFAIMVWWKLDDPFLAVLMVSAIDGIGYIPTIRKSFKDPWSETLFFWVMITIADFLALFANDQYNFLTTTYLATLFAASSTLVLVCFFRRISINKRNKKIFSKKEVLEKQDFFVREIKSGKVFIYPTDTLYGFGCDAENKESVKRILQIKKRTQKPLLVVAPNMNWIFENCEIESEKIREKILEKLPGPFSFIFKLKNGSCVSNLVTNGKETLGVRIPDNWFFDLISKSNTPFISTSVNLSGESSAVKFSEISNEIINAVDYVICDDESLGGKPSTIIDFSFGEEKILRK